MKLTHYLRTLDNVCYVNQDRKLAHHPYSHSLERRVLPGAHQHTWIGSKADVSQIAQLSTSGLAVRIAYRLQRS
jgi:hypothetical protein